MVGFRAGQQVVAAERRLGHSLPPSLREFLLVTNGWRNAGSFIYRLAGTSDLAWLRDAEDRRQVALWNRPSPPDGQSGS